MAELSRVKVNNPDGVADEVVVRLIDMMEEENGRRVVECDVRRTGNADEYGITPTFEKVPFARIRRVTGYLAGDVRSFNNAKRAEEHDRVKHAV